MRSRSNSSVRLDGYARLGQQTILCHQCQDTFPICPHPKIQKADLCRVWTELCMRESQARIRNQQLLQDFLGLESQLAVLAAKTDALRRRKVMAGDLLLFQLISRQQRSIHLDKMATLRAYEEFLQRLRRDLPKHQGASKGQGLVSDKAPELLARPLSAEWEGQLPFETEYQSEPPPFDPFDIAPSHAPGAHGRLGPGFWEYNQGKAPLEHPFHSPTAHPARKHGSPALPSLWSPQRLQKDKKARLVPGQGRSHASSSQPWPVPGRTTMLGRSLPLPEERLGPVMAQVPEGQSIGSPTANSIFQGTEERRYSILSNGASADEHRDVLVRREAHCLARDPAGLSYHLRLHGDTPSCMDVPESQLGLPRMCLGNDSSGASVSLAEVNSGHWTAERTTKGLPRQQRMKAKHQDADTVILNEDSVHMSWERSPRLLKHEEMAIIQGPRKVLRQETLPCWEEPGDGELREKGESNSVDEGGEATGSLDLGLEQTAKECRPQREVGAQEDEEIKGRTGGLEQGQDDQDGSNVGEVGSAGVGNSPGCFEQRQKDLERDSVGEREQAHLGSGSQEGGSMEGERNLQGSNGEGEKDDQEEEGRSAEKYSEPDRSGERQNSVNGDKQGDLELATGSQEEPSHPKEKEDASSTNSSSSEVVMGPKMCITSKEVNSGQCQTPSLQSEGPLAAETESICGEEEDENEEEEEEEEEEDEEEEESEADTDIEAALAPHSNKLETTRDQQVETVIPDFQELEADSEEVNKDGDLHDKDDFYD